MTSKTAADVDVMVEAEVDGFVASFTISADFASLALLGPPPGSGGQWLELHDVESELKSLLRGDLDTLRHESTFPSAGPDDYKKNVRLTKEASVEIVAKGFAPGLNVKLDHIVKVGNIGKIEKTSCRGDYSQDGYDYEPHCWTVAAESNALDDVVNAVVSLTASVIGDEENTKTDEVDLEFKTRPELHWYMPEATAKDKKNIWRPYEEAWKIVIPVHNWHNSKIAGRGSKKVIIKPRGFEPGAKISVDFDQKAGKSFVDAYWNEVKQEYELTATGRDFANVEVRAYAGSDSTSKQPVQFMMYPLTLEMDPAPPKDNVLKPVSIVVRPNYVESTIPTKVTVTLPRHGTKEVKVVAKGFFTFNDDVDDDVDIDFNVMVKKEGETSEVTDGKKTPGFKRSIEDSVLTLMVSQAGEVTVRASEVDGGDTYSAIPLTITFLSPKPWLVVDADSWWLGREGRNKDWRLKQDADSWMVLEDRGSLKLSNNHVSSAVDTIPYGDPGAGDDFLKCAVVFR